MTTWVVRNRPGWPQANATHIAAKIGQLACRQVLQGHVELRLVRRLRKLMPTREDRRGPAALPVVAARPEVTLAEEDR